MSAARCGFLRARALPFGLARARFCLRSDLLLWMQAFRKILAPGGAIPLLVRLVLDLSLDEKMSELAALCLLLNGIVLPLFVGPLQGLDGNRFAPVPRFRLGAGLRPESGLVIEVRQLVEPSRPGGHRSEHPYLLRRPCGKDAEGDVALGGRGPERSSHAAVQAAACAHDDPDEHVGGGGGAPTPGVRSLPLLG